MHHGSSGSRTTLRSTADCATGWNWATWATTAQASPGKRGSATRLRTTRITAAMPGGPSTAASVKATSPRQRTSRPEGSPARAVAAMAGEPAASAASPGDLLVISPPRLPTEARTGARPRGGNRRLAAPASRKGRLGGGGGGSAGLPVLRLDADQVVSVGMGWHEELAERRAVPQVRVGACPGPAEGNVAGRKRREDERLGGPAPLVGPTPRG